ncbi:glycoside hydrolase family 15 protein [Labrys wisconsinensis]|uniref:glucan 1,4-alpha-glucosidase n=1 Tax=Labrys wisconsinensis TaxID=425677 RepID=A0ABU0JGH0_9HYPH|nr:glycoside hydrolase family 15 protein [Labrys wisconsinensis]MDQ0473396.1 glucoamylase [Labrys wisconsinensis]
MDPLSPWIDRQYRHAAAAMLRSISPVGIVKARPGFGQTVVPKRGAIVASPVLGDWKPEPDYFFHWYRDSAVVIDALRLLHADGTLGPEALGHLGDFVRFSLSLQQLDGRALARDPAWRAAVAPDFIQYLRSDAELAAVHGEEVVAETRVNPDGTLDISTWSRPQNDGAATRALALLRWLKGGAAIGAELAADIADLLHADLAFTLARWRRPCFDLWEEQSGRHYYTLRVQAAALAEGAPWLAELGGTEAAAACGREAHAILAQLDGYWLAEEGFYRSRLLDPPARTTKDLDIAVILAALHADGAEAAHSPRDPRMLATLASLEALFDRDFPINRGRPPGRAAALGRYEGDGYFGGGAWYVSTLAGAELCFRAAAAAAPAEAAGLEARGDAFLATVQAFTPENGDMSEQFDRATGEQTSARHLAWSYAAFITCIAARRTLAG